MELITAQAIAILLSTPNWRKPKLFVADEYSYYRVMDIEYDEEYAVLTVRDVNRKSTSYRKIFRDRVFTFPIREFKRDAQADFAILLAERMEKYLSNREAGVF